MPGSERTLPLEEWQRLKIQIFWCYEGRPPGVPRISRYRTPNYSAWLVRRGEAEISFRGRTHSLRTGDWVIVPPPTYERRFTENIELLSVHFRLTWVDDGDLFALTQPVIFPAARRPRLERAVRRLRRFFDSHGTRGQFESIAQPLTLAGHLHFQTLAGRFAVTLTEALEAEGALSPDYCQRPSAQIGQILSHLHHRPLDLPWNSANAASALGMSTGHLDRVFRHEYGQTPRQYFDTRRLEHAKHGIVAGKGSIKEVAAGLGFTSAAFCRWFRQAVGASPTLYRQNIGLPRAEISLPTTE